MTRPSFQLTSNCLLTAFQLPVFQLAMPIELARWKVGRTFHLARALYRPRRPSRLRHRAAARPIVGTPSLRRPLDGIGPTP